MFSTKKKINVFQQELEPGKKKKKKNLLEFFSLKTKSRGKKHVGEKVFCLEPKHFTSERKAEAWVG